MNLNDIVSNYMGNYSATPSQCCCNTATSTGTSSIPYNNWVTTTTDYTFTYPAFVTEDKLNVLKEEVEKIKNNLKEKKPMFESFTKNLKCGRAQDVRMSVYGPAFAGQDNRWYTIDEENQLLDVTELLFGNESFCYMMPVSVNQIEVGSYILHNDCWCKVTGINNEHISVLNIAKKELLLVVPTKSPFGFNFYTKLIPLIDFKGFEATSENPFGNLPMMMLLGEKNSDMFPFLLMQNQKFDMSNPMMMYFLMRDKKSNENDNSWILPFLLTSKVKMDQENKK